MLNARTRTALSGALLLGMLAASGGVLAELRRVTAADYKQAVTELKAGDMLELLPGEYDGLTLHNIRGTSSAPITITGKGDRTVIVAHESRNTVSIRDSAYLVVRNMKLKGDGVATDGVVCEHESTSAHDITIEGLNIEGFGYDRSTVGIATRCPAWRWTIRRNRIVNPGTGMYLGGSDGGAPFIASVLEENEIVDPLGYAIQIKHQNARAALKDMPSDSSFTVLRKNRFIKTRAEADPSAARPTLLIGHFPLEGVGSNDLYLIHGNFFYDNPSESLLQGEGNLAVYNNIFVNPRGDAVRIQPHKDKPRRVLVFHNTIVASGVGVSVRGGVAGVQRVVAGNVAFAARPYVGEVAGKNVGGDIQEASRVLAAPSGDWKRMDLSPRDQELQGDADIPEAVLRLPGAPVDYRGLARLAPVFGACLPLGMLASPVPCR